MFLIHKGLPFFAYLYLSNNPNEAIFCPSFFYIVFITLFIRCEKEGACDEFKVSLANENESHNFGNNCMQCHYHDGGGEGCFSVAGSVRNVQQTGPQTIGVVEFYTEPNGGGTLKYTVNLDAKGNFYSS